MDFGDLAERLLPVVAEAAEVQMGIYRAGDVEVARKADSSPVTEADRLSEAVLLAGLAAIAPDIPVVAEEAASAGRIPEVRGNFFLVDPLDGTREFINQRDEFTINIALVCEGRARFGLVHAPALSRLFVTSAAEQAVQCRLEAGKAPSGGLAELSCQRLQVRKPDIQALSVCASRSHLDEQTSALLEKYRVGERKSAGSSLKFCLIAAGEADLYPRLGRTMEWDTAAGDAVLRAAGGAVLTLDGKDLSYGKAGDGFANPGFIAVGDRAVAGPAIVS